MLSWVKLWEHFYFTMKKQVRLRRGDFLERIKKFKDNTVDCTITSPPYDDIRDYENSLVWNIDVCASMAEELYRVSKDGAVVCWVVADQTKDGSESGNAFRQALTFMQAGFKLHDTMIYHKENPPPTGGNNRLFQAWEYLFVFSKGKPKTFNPKMIKRKNKYNDKRTQRTKNFVRGKDGKHKEKRTVELREIVKATNILSYVVGGGNSTMDKDAFQHPAIFPEHLVYDLILMYTNEGDLIVDPMHGSGTVGKMCVLTNRRILGFEKVHKYFDIEIDRISRYHAHIQEGKCVMGGFDIRDRDSKNKLRPDLCPVCRWRLLA